MAICDKPFFAISPSYLGEAIQAHDKYLRALDAWDSWLWTASQDESLKLFLFKIIDNVINLRKPGGAWAEVDEDVVPQWDTIENIVRADDRNSPYSILRAKIETMRGAIESSAEQLILMLQTEELYEEFECLSSDDQIEYYELFMDSLYLSNAGLRFLVESMQPEADGTLPLFHPDRIIKSSLTFRDIFRTGRRVSRPLIQTFTHLLPALIKKDDIVAFSRMVHNFYSKFIDMPAEGLGDSPPMTLEELEASTLRIKAYLDRHPRAIEIGAQSMSGLLMILSIINAYTVVLRIKRDPNTRNTFGLFRALADMRLAMNTAAKTGLLAAKYELAKRPLAIISCFAGIHDVVVGAMDASDSWGRGDYSVMAGNIIETFGLALAAGVSTAKAMGAGGLVGSPVGAAILGISGFLIAFTGILVINLTRDSALETWFEQNYFGRHWDDVDTSAKPQHISFKWRRVDGTPDLGRQISEFLSMFFPLGLQLIAIPPRNPAETWSLSVRVEPKLAYHESEIAVKRIDDTSSFLEPSSYIFIPIYMKPINTPHDTFGPGGDPRNIYAPVHPTDDQKLVEWFRIFSPLELTHGINPNFNPTDRWFEVEITIPDKYDSSISEMFLSGGANFDDILGKFPFVLRSRKRADTE